MANLTAELAEKSQKLSNLEYRCNQLEESLADSNKANQDSAQEKEIIETLRSNLSLVQTELARVQTEAGEASAKQEEDINNFKATVFAEQEELNQIVLELSSENETLKDEQKSFEKALQEKDELILDLQKSLQEMSQENIVANESNISDEQLAELNVLSNSCHQTLKQLVQSSKQQLERENKLAVAFNSPDSEATMLSVKLSELTDQFEVLKFNYQKLQLQSESETSNGMKSSELAKKQSEIEELKKLVSDLKEENATKKVELLHSQDTLQAIQHNYREQEKMVNGASKPRNGEVVEVKVQELNLEVSKLEKQVADENRKARESMEKVATLTSKLEAVESEKEAFRKKISDFVALGDMREVGWQSEREELTKSIQKLTQDINFLRLNEKRLSEDALLANGVKRVSLEDKAKTVAHISDNLGCVIDTTSRSRLAAQRAIKSGDLESLCNELLHQVYRFEQLREHNAKLLQKLQRNSNNIQVCCRLRPPSEQELGQGADICLDVVDDKEIAMYDKRISIWKSFEFDKVWDEDATQLDVFVDVEPLALSAVDGYNACIFAYGMTGSGKTYTMNGYGSDYGVSYRVVHKIFELLSMKRTSIEKGVELRKSLIRKSSRRSGHGRKLCASPIDSVSVHDSGSPIADEPTFTSGATYTKKSFHFSVTVSMLEIYNETVKDLLNTDPRVQPTGGMDIRHDGEGNVSVPGLVAEDVSSLEDVISVLDRGSANRATASTNVNEHSSRSHCIVMINVTTVSNGGVPVQGKLSLVDLAGSERVERSGAQGRQLKEAQHINRSLSALGDVLEALENKSKHIPYRNSKLTYLLQDSLGGNSRTMMIATVCPTELTADETLFCLQFATRARKIQLDSSKKNVSWKTIEESLKQVKAELKEEKKKHQTSIETIKSLKVEIKKSKDKMSSQLGFKLKNSDESRKSGEQKIQLLTRTNAELMLRLQEEKEQMKNMYLDMETNQKAMRRVQEQLKHCKAERDRILATQGYKDQENQNLREMVRLYEENEEEYLQQENQQHNNGSMRHHIKTRVDLNRSHSERRPRLSGGSQGLASSYSMRETRQPRYVTSYCIVVKK